MSRRLNSLSSALRHAQPPAQAAQGSSSAVRASSGRNCAATAHPGAAPHLATARPFSTSVSVSLPPQAVSPRPPIPTEVIRSRPAEVESSEDSTIEAEDDGYVPPPLTSQQLSLLYAYTSPPPLSALSAFASRLALSTSSSSHSLAVHLPLVEQCLIHESFWSGLDQLPLPSSAHARTYTNFHDAPTADSPTHTPQRAHNGALAAVGNALLGTLTTELLIGSFPNLPTRASKAALSLYSGPKSLAAIATSWGVAPSRLEMALVGREDEGKVSRKERAYGHLVGGRGGPRKVGNEVGAKESAAGSGLLRWNRKATSPTTVAVLFEDALASVTRAVIGAIYHVHGFAAARAFVHSHILSQLVPPQSTTLASASASSSLVPLLKFTNPSRILSLQLTSHGLAPLSHRLLKESGRLSAHPTFVSGAFSGDVKLGEGFGSSLRMSEYRASEDALRRAFLGGGRLDTSETGRPSDVWTEGEFKGWSGAVGWQEVEHETRSPSKRL
ncbi:hypothetical protein JCM1841_005591 [Sporobolomyces salmonicolor]